LLATLGVVVGLALALVVWRAAGDEDTTGTAADGGQPTSSQEARQEPSQQATPTTPSASEPATVQVNPSAYLGRDHKDVTKELEQLGLSVTEQEVANPGDVGEGLVIDLQPTGAVPLDQTVTVSYTGKQPEGGGEKGGGNGEEGGGNGEEGGGNGNEGGGNGGEGNGTQGRDG